MKTSAQNAVTKTEVKYADSGIYFQGTCGKTTAIVSIHTYGMRVIVQNASHQAWRGMGRMFPTIADALAGYKKDDVKAIITAANELNH